MSTRKLSATIDPQVFTYFEKMRKTMGFRSRSKAVEVALKRFTQELMMEKLEQECKGAKEAQGEVSEFIEASEEMQGEALKNILG